MKAKLAFASFLLVGSMALADIPVPPQDAVSRTTLGKAESLSLWSALNVPSKQEFSGHVYDGRYKVWRAPSGLAQIVCTANCDKGDGSAKDASCELQQSNNGKALPAYRPRRLRG